MPHTPRQDHLSLPRRVRRSAPSAPVSTLAVHPYGRADTTGTDDVSDLAGAVRSLLHHRPDLGHPTPLLITELLAALTEVHRLAVSIDAADEAADIARLVGTLRCTPA